MTAQPIDQASEENKIAQAEVAPQDSANLYTEAHLHRDSLNDVSTRGNDVSAELKKLIQNEQSASDPDPSRSLNRLTLDERVTLGFQAIMRAALRRNANPGVMASRLEQLKNDMPQGWGVAVDYENGDRSLPKSFRLTRRDGNNTRDLSRIQSEDFWATTRSLSDLISGGQATSFQLSEKFSEVLRNQANDGTTEPERIAARINAGLDPTKGYRVRFDSNANQILFEKTDNSGSSVLRRVETRLLGVASHQMTPDMMASYAAEPMGQGIMDAEQQGEHLQRLQRWLSTRNEGDRQLFFQNLQRQLASRPETAGINQADITRQLAFEYRVASTSINDLLLEAVRVSSAIPGNNLVSRNGNNSDNLEPEQRTVLPALEAETSRVNLTRLMGPTRLDAINGARFQAQDTIYRVDRAGAITSARVKSVDSDGRIQEVELAAGNGNGPRTVRFDQWALTPSMPEKTVFLAYRPPQDAQAARTNTSNETDLSRVVSARDLQGMNPEQLARVRTILDTNATPQEKLLAGEALFRSGKRNFSFTDTNGRNRNVRLDFANGYGHIWTQANNGRSVIGLRGYKNGDTYVQQHGENEQQVSFYGDVFTRHGLSESLLASRPRDNAPRNDNVAATVVGTTRLPEGNYIRPNDTAAFSGRMRDYLTALDPTSNLTGQAGRSVVADFQAFAKISQDARAVSESFSSAIRAEALLNPGLSSQEIIQRFNDALKEVQGGKYSVAAQNAGEINLLCQGQIQATAKESELLSPASGFASLVKDSNLSNGEIARLFSNFVRMERQSQISRQGNNAASLGAIAENFKRNLSVQGVNNFDVTFNESEGGRIILSRSGVGADGNNLRLAAVETRHLTGRTSNQRENLDQLVGRIAEPLGKDIMNQAERQRYWSQIMASLRNADQSFRGDFVNRLKAELARRPETNHINIAQAEGQPVTMDGMIASDTETLPAIPDLASLQRIEAPPTVSGAGESRVDLARYLQEGQLERLNDAQKRAVSGFLSAANVDERLKASEAIIASGLTNLKIKDLDGTPRNLRFSEEKKGQLKEIVVWESDRGGNSVYLRALTRGDGTYTRQRNDRNNRSVDYYGDRFKKRVPDSSILRSGRAEVSQAAPQNTPTQADRQPIQPVTRSVEGLFDPSKIERAQSVGPQTLEHREVLRRLPDPEHLYKRAQELPADQRPPQQRPPEQTVADQRPPAHQGTASPFNVEAVLNSLKDAGLNNTAVSADFERMRAILRDYSREQLATVREEFNRKNGKSIDDAFNDLFASSDRSKATELIMLTEGKNDRVTRVTRLMQEAAQLWNGRWNAYVEKDLRDTISSMSQREFQEFDQEYRTRNGQSFMDAVGAHSRISELTKRALDIYKNGRDQITPEQTRSLVQLAVDLNTRSSLFRSWRVDSLDLFKEAMRYATPQAREQFFRPPSGEPGHAIIDRLFSGTNRQVAMDYARHGNMRADTEVSINRGTVLWDNKEAIDQAIANMTPETVRSYFAGKALENRAPSNEQEQKDRELYRAFSAEFARRGEWEQIRLEDRMKSPPNGSVINNFLRHWGSIYNSSTDEMMKTIEGMNANDLARARDANTGRQFMADFEKVVNAAVSNPETRTRLMTAFYNKLGYDKSANTFREGVQVEQTTGRSLLDSLKDKVGWPRNDRAGMFRAIMNMTPDQLTQYRANPSAVDSYVKENIGSFYQPAAERILRLVREGKDPTKDLPSALAQLYLDSAPTAKVVAEMEKLFREQPDLRRMIKSPANDEERQISELTRQFASYAMDGSVNIFNNYKNYGQALIEQGAIDASRKMDLHRGPLWFANDIKGVVDTLAASSPSEIQNIATNARTVFPFLNENELNLVTAIARNNGRVENEHRMRAAILYGDAQAVKELLEKVPAAERLTLRNNYERAFNRLLTDDLRRMNNPETLLASRLFEGERTATQIADANLDDARSYNRGLGNWLTSLGSGTGHQLEAAIDRASQRASESGMLNRELTAEEKRQLVELVGKAITNYSKAQHAAGDAVVTGGLLTVGVVGTVLLSASGVGLPAAAALCALMGATLQPVIKKGVISHYEFRDADGNISHEFKVDAALGSLMGAVPVAPAHLARLLPGLRALSGTLARTVAAGDEVVQMSRAASGQILESQITKGAITSSNAMKAEKVAELLAPRIAGATETAGRHLIDRAAIESLTPQAIEAATSGIVRNTTRQIVDEAARLGFDGLGQKAASEFARKFSAELSTLIKANAEQLVGKSTSEARTLINGMVERLVPNLYKETIPAMAQERMQDIFRKGMLEMVSEAHAHGRSVTRADILQLIGRATRNPKEAAQLEHLFRSSIQTAFETQVGGPLRSFLTQTNAIAMLGGADGLARGIIQIDPSESYEQNIQRILFSAASGYAAGGVMAGGIFVGPMSLWRAYKGNHPEFLRDVRRVAADNVTPGKIDRTVTDIDTTVVRVKTFNPDDARLRPNAEISELNAARQSGAHLTTAEVGVDAHINFPSQAKELGANPRIVNQGEGTIRVITPGNAEVRLAKGQELELPHGSRIRFGDGEREILLLKNNDRWSTIPIPTGEEMGIRHVAATLSNANEVRLTPRAEIRVGGPRADVNTASGIEASIQGNLLRNFSTEALVVRQNGKTHVLPGLKDWYSPSEIRLSAGAHFRKQGTNESVKFEPGLSGTVLRSVDLGQPMPGQRTMVHLRTGSESENILRRTFANVVDTAYRVANDRSLRDLAGRVSARNIDSESVASRLNLSRADLNQNMTGRNLTELGFVRVSEPADATQIWSGNGLRVIAKGDDIQSITSSNGVYTFERSGNRITRVNLSDGKSTDLVSASRLPTSNKEFPTGWNKRDFDTALPARPTDSNQVEVYYVHNSRQAPNFSATPENAISVHTSLERALSDSAGGDARYVLRAVVDKSSLIVTADGAQAIKSGAFANFKVHIASQDHPLNDGNLWRVANARSGENTLAHNVAIDLTDKSVVLSRSLVDAIEQVKAFSPGQAASEQIRTLAAQAHANAVRAEQPIINIGRNKIMSVGRQAENDIVLKGRVPGNMGHFNSTDATGGATQLRYRGEAIVVRDGKILKAADNFYDLQKGDRLIFGRVVNAELGLFKGLEFEIAAMANGLTPFQLRQITGRSGLFSFKSGTTSGAASPNYARLRNLGAQIQNAANKSWTVVSGTIPRKLRAAWDKIPDWQTARQSIKDGFSFLVSKDGALLRLREGAKYLSERTAALLRDYWGSLISRNLVYTKAEKSLMASERRLAKLGLKKSEGKSFTLDAENNFHIVDAPPAPNTRFSFRTPQKAVYENSDGSIRYFLDGRRVVGVAKNDSGTLKTEVIVKWQQGRLTEVNYPHNAIKRSDRIPSDLIFNGRWSGDAIDARITPTPPKHTRLYLVLAAGDEGKQFKPRMNQEKESFFRSVVSGRRDLSPSEAKRFAEIQANNRHGPDPVYTTDYATAMKQARLYGNRSRLLYVDIEDSVLQTDKFSKTITSDKTGYRLSHEHSKNSREHYLSPGNPYRNGLVRTSFRSANDEFQDVLFRITDTGLQWRNAPSFGRYGIDVHTPGVVSRGRGENHVLTQFEELTLGSGKGSDIYARSPDLEPQHATVRIKENTVEVTAASEGALINVLRKEGDKFTVVETAARVVAADGERIRVGSEVFQVAIKDGRAVLTHVETFNSGGTLRSLLNRGRISRRLNEFNADKDGTINLQEAQVRRNATNNGFEVKATKVWVEEAGVFNLKEVADAATGVPLASGQRFRLTENGHIYQAQGDFTKSARLDSVVRTKVAQGPSLQSRASSFFSSGLARVRNVADRLKPAKPTVMTEEQVNAALKELPLPADVPLRAIVINERPINFNDMASAMQDLKTLKGVEAQRRIADALKSLRPESASMTHTEAQSVIARLRELIPPEVAKDVKIAKLGNEGADVYTISIKVFGADVERSFPRNAAMDDFALIGLGQKGEIQAAIAKIKAGENAAEEVTAAFKSLAENRPTMTVSDARRLAENLNRQIKDEKSPSLFRYRQVKTDKGEDAVHVYLSTKDNVEDVVAGQTWRLGSSTDDIYNPLLQQLAQNPAASGQVVVRLLEGAAARPLTLSDQAVTNIRVLALTRLNAPEIEQALAPITAMARTAGANKARLEKALDQLKSKLEFFRLTDTADINIAQLKEAITRLEANSAMADTNMIKALERAITANLSKEEVPNAYARLISLANNAEFDPPAQIKDLVRGLVTKLENGKPEVLRRFAQELELAADGKIPVVLDNNELKILVADSPNAQLRFVRQGEQVMVERPGSTPQAVARGDHYDVRTGPAKDADVYRITVDSVENGKIKVSQRKLTEADSAPPKTNPPDVPPKTDPSDAAPKGDANTAADVAPSLSRVAATTDHPVTGGILRVSLKLGEITDNKAAASFLIGEAAGDTAFSFKIVGNKVEVFSTDSNFRVRLRTETKVIRRQSGRNGNVDKYSAPQSHEPSYSAVSRSQQHATPIENNQVIVVSNKAGNQKFDDIEIKFNTLVEGNPPQVRITYESRLREAPSASNPAARPAPGAPAASAGGDLAETSQRLMREFQALEQSKVKSPQEYLGILRSIDANPQTVSPELLEQVLKRSNHLVPLRKVNGKNVSEFKSMQAVIEQTEEAIRLIGSIKGKLNNPEESTLQSLNFIESSLKTRRFDHILSRDKYPAPDDPRWLSAETYRANDNETILTTPFGSTFREVRLVTNGEESPALRFISGNYWIEHMPVVKLRGPVKVQVLYSNQEELPALYAALLPYLSRTKQEPWNENLLGFKAANPLMMNPSTGKLASAVESEKAFVIYASTTEDAVKIARGIDQVLKARGLARTQTEAEIRARLSKNLPLEGSESGRVALVQDLFESSPGIRYQSGKSVQTHGAVLSPTAMKAIREKYSWPSDKPLTSAQLETFARENGVESFSLGTTDKGDLIVIHGKGEQVRSTSGSRFYLPEDDDVYSLIPPERWAGRRAFYHINEKYDRNPVSNLLPENVARDVAPAGPAVPASVLASRQRPSVAGLHKELDEAAESLRNGGTLAPEQIERIRTQLTKALNEENSPVDVFIHFQEAAQDATGQRFSLSLKDNNLILRHTGGTEEIAVPLTEHLNRMVGTFDDNFRRVDAWAAALRMEPDEQLDVFVERALRERSKITGLFVKPEMKDRLMDAIRARARELQADRSQPFFREADRNELYIEAINSDRRFQQGTLSRIDESSNKPLQDRQINFMRDALAYARRELNLSEDIPRPPRDQGLTFDEKKALKISGATNLDEFFQGQMARYVDVINSLKSSGLPPEQILIRAYNEADRLVPLFGQLQIGQGLTTEARNDFAYAYQSAIRARLAAAGKRRIIDTDPDPGPGPGPGPTKGSSDAGDAALAPARAVDTSLSKAEQSQALMRETWEPNMSQVDFIENMSARLASITGEPQDGIKAILFQSIVTDKIPFVDSQGKLVLFDNNNFLERFSSTFTGNAFSKVLRDQQAAARLNQALEGVRTLANSLDNGTGNLGDMVVADAYLPAIIALKDSPEAIANLNADQANQLISLARRHTPSERIEELNAFFSRPEFRARLGSDQSQSQLDSLISVMNARQAAHKALQEVRNARGEANEASTYLALLEQVKNNRDSIDYSLASEIVKAAPNRLDASQARQVLDALDSVIGRDNSLSSLPEQVSVQFTALRTTLNRRLEAAQTRESNVRQNNLLKSVSTKINSDDDALQASGSLIAATQGLAQESGKLNEASVEGILRAVQTRMFSNDAAQIKAQLDLLKARPDVQSIIKQKSNIETLFNRVSEQVTAKATRYGALDELFNAASDAQTIQRLIQEMQTPRAGEWLDSTYAARLAETVQNHLNKINPELLTQEQILKMQTLIGEISSADGLNNQAKRALMNARKAIEERIVTEVPPAPRPPAPARTTSAEPLTLRDTELEYAASPSSEFRIPNAIVSNETPDDVVFRHLVASANQPEVRIWVGNEHDLDNALLAIKRFRNSSDNSGVQIKLESDTGLSLQYRIDVIGKETVGQSFYHSHVGEQTNAGKNIYLHKLLRVVANEEESMDSINTYIAGTYQGIASRSPDEGLSLIRLDNGTYHFMDNLPGPVFVGQSLQDLAQAIRSNSNMPRNIEELLTLMSNTNGQNPQSTITALNQWCRTNTHNQFFFRLNSKNQIVADGRWFERSVVASSDQSENAQIFSRLAARDQQAAAQVIDNDVELINSLRLKVENKEELNSILTSTFDRIISGELRISARDIESLLSITSEHGDQSLAAKVRQSIDAVLDNQTNLTLDDRRTIVDSLQRFRTPSRTTDIFSRPAVQDVRYGLKVGDNVTGPRDVEGRLVDFTSEEHPVIRVNNPSKAGAKFEYREVNLHLPGRPMEPGAVVEGIYHQVVPWRSPEGEDLFYNLGLGMVFRKVTETVSRGRIRKVVTQETRMERVPEYAIFGNGRVRLTQQPEP